MTLMILTEFLNDLLDEVGDDVEHPFYPLIETLGTLVENYEQRTMPEPDVTPASILGFLIEENHLKTEDVRELGSDDTISELLHGTQEFNLSQIKFLCRRFHLKPDIFMSLQ